MWTDIRQALRTLRRFRPYTIAAALTLAVGIGAATAVFSIIDATLLRSLPYRDPDRLVALRTDVAAAAGTAQVLPPSQIELVTWRASTRLEGVEAAELRTVALTGHGDPEVIDTSAITSGLLPLLGAAPAIGRLFTDAEERQNAAVVILSQALWQRRFNSDPNVLGQSIVLGGRAHTVIGVMPRDFQFVFDASTAWTPLNPVIDPARQANRLMSAVARLRPDATLSQAQAELAALSAPLATQFPVGHSQATPIVEGLRDSLFGSRAPALRMLGLAALALLLLACANVANLTLNHLLVRQGELAMRSLLGAGIGRILRMLMVQTGVLAAAGGAIGIGIAAAVLPSLLNLYNSGGAVAVTLGLDWRVLSICAATIGGTTLVCTLLPAVRIHRAAARGDGLRLAATRVSAGRAERRVRATLVCAQIALAIALLCTSGALVKSLTAVLSVAPGFTANRVLTMQMMLPPALYPDVPARAQFVERMLDRVREVPGVVAAGTTQSTFLPNQGMLTFMFVENVTLENADRAAIRHITPGYFDALRVPIVEGRAIDVRDRIGTQPVCMVSASFAKLYFPNGSAVGKRVRRARNTVVWMTIVGVAADVMDVGLVTPPLPMLYVPYLQDNTATARISLVARTQGDPARLAVVVRQAIWDVDRNQPISRIAPLDAVLLEGASAERFRALLVGLFAAAGVLLAIVGIYAMTAASVTAQTWESSLRIALGARPWRIGLGVIRDASIQVLAGSALGLAAFWSLQRLISGLLFQTSAMNGTVIVASVAGMTLLALSAAALQARRLTSVSPVLGLRGPDAVNT
ncbi:MAG TPA: ADOP family duplicated permease [Vicinamibacterales bacterium]|nr:ADOP family duplicated permease [Vicinamibacterales bacterium]